MSHVRSDNSRTLQDVFHPLLSLREKLNGEDGLRLDTKEGAFADLDGHFALVPGDLEASELIRRIRSEDPDEVMPPPDFIRQLSKEDKDLIRRWIEQGA